MKKQEDKDDRSCIAILVQISEKIGISQKSSFQKIKQQLKYVSFFFAKTCTQAHLCIAKLPFIIQNYLKADLIN